MQLTIGASRLRNTDGIVRIRGSRQIVLEWGPFDSELLLTMDLYGAGGGHIARLWRNQWTFNDHHRFDFATSPRGFNLVDTRLSTVVLEARIVGQDSVVITQGAFYSSEGREVQITTEDWNGRKMASPTPTVSSTQSTNPPFAAGEVARIRKAVLSSSQTIECPRCSCPLTRERLTTPAHPDSVMVSCITCRRNLIVRCEA